MVSRVAVHVLGTLGGIVALLAVPGNGFPQSQPQQVDAKDRIAEEIVAAEEQGGPRSPALIEPLTELGALYEAEGQHALATAALEQARQIVRINYGLHTLEQVPLMQQALVNQQALGNFAMVQAIEEELLGLAERYSDDLRTVAIHRDAGRRRMDVLRRFVAGEAPGEVYPETGVYSFFNEDVIVQLVSDAQIHYAGAAAVILRNGLYSSDELRGVEMEIVRASHMAHQQNNPSIHSRPAAMPVTPRDNTFSSVSNNRLYRSYDYDRPFYNPTLEARTNALSALASGADVEDVRAALQDAPAAVQDAADAPDAIQGLRGDGMTSRYQLGRDSYSRLIAYDERAFGESADEAGLRSRLEAYLQLADWDLLYSQNGTALDQYAQVHELLTTTDIGKPLIAAIFAPAIPIVLPAFVPNPLKTQESALYVDVAFEITKYGESRRVEIVGAVPNVSDAAKDELVTLVKGSRFRPRVTDGDLGRASPVVVRYYFDD